jgi:chitodextrinase
MASPSCRKKLIHHALRLSLLALAALVAGTTAYLAPPGTAATGGPVAAYSFDAGSGSTVADATGNGNTGTIANAAWSTSGHSGSALSFNGRNSWVTVPDAASLHLTTGYTLEAWVRPATTSRAWRTAVLKEDPARAELDYGLYASTDSGTPSAHVLVGNPPDSFVRGSSASPLNSWTHLAATYNGTTLRIYANGAQQASKAVTGAIGTSNGALRIGGNNIWSEWFSGLIDDVRVYNRALTATEIQTDMNTPVGGSVTPPPPPPPGDTMAPTAPTGVAASGGTQSTMQLAWNASSDNVGVAGYDVSVNGSTVATTSATTYTVTGLGCGASYTFAVDAYDAAGNRSAKTSTAGTTTACSSSGANEYVSPSGSDANACTAAAQCKSFDRAYHVARPGDTIEVAGGTYPGQTITLDTSKVTATSDVVLLPAAGATVTISGDLNVYGSHLQVRGSSAGNFKLHNLNVLGTAGSNTAQHDIFENLDGAGFQIGPTSFITIKGGDWGPNYVCGGGGTVENKVGPDGAIANQWPTNIVLDGLYIHDQNSENLNSCHMGGLFLISGGPITLRNSTFSQTVVYDIQIQNFTSASCCGMNYGPVHDVTIENNWFGTPVTGLADPTGGNATDNQPDVQFDPRNGECWKNILVRFNSFTNGPDLGFDNPACFQNVRVVANIGGANGCFPGVTYGYNAWLGGTCAASDVSIGSLPYRSKTVGAENYDLTGGVAMNLVSPTTGDYALTTDIHGSPRPGPTSPNRDAGADEAG